MSITQDTYGELQEIAARYPEARSGLLPMLHLVQSEEGYVSPSGMEMCAEVLGLTTAEVAAVATFYTMYVRKPGGKHHVGDMPELMTDANGTANISFNSSSLKLRGPNSIIGKAVIVHAAPDDVNAQPSGNAGARLVCGVIKQD